MKLASSDSVFSLDVVSLFTNILLDLALEKSLAKRWIHIKPFTKIPKPEFMEMVNFVLSSTYFSFNNVIYKQTFGTPMVHLSHPS